MSDRMWYERPSFVRQAVESGSRGGRVSGEVRKALRIEKAIAAVSSYHERHGCLPRPMELAKDAGIDYRTAAGWIDVFVNL
jgi:hypothetical protein